MVFINHNTSKFNTSNAHNTNPLSQHANDNQDDINNNQDNKKNKSDLIPWIVGGAVAVGAVVAIAYFTKGKGAEKAAKKLELKDLVAVHMTGQLPNNLEIKSTRAATEAADGVSEYRDTVHFALNHAVGAHGAGGWNYKKYAILAPLEGIVQANPGGHFQGVPIDFYHKGTVKLPKGTIIVRRAKGMPQDSSYKILKPDKICHVDIDSNTYANIKDLARAEDANFTEEEATELKKLASQGVKIINAPNPHAAVSAIIKGEMGRSSRPTGELFTWGDSYNNTTPESVANLNAWKKFATAHGWEVNAHTYSPLGNIETVLGFTQDLAENNNAWTHSKNKKEIIDYRAKLLDVLKKLKGKNVDINVDELTSIIQESNTPKEALAKIQKSMKIKPMASLNVKSLHLNFEEQLTGCTTKDLYAMKFHVMYGDKITMGDLAGDLFSKPTISSEDFANFKKRTTEYRYDLYNHTKNNKVCIDLGIK